MPIFNDMLGYVPLPNSQSVQSNIEEGNSDLAENQSSNSIETTNSNLPVNVSPTLANRDQSIVDDLYNKLDNVTGFLHLPRPEIADEIFKGVNYVEGVLKDPLQEGKRLLEIGLFNLFNPNSGDTEGFLPSNRSVERIEFSRDEFTELPDTIESAIPIDRNKYSKVDYDYNNQSERSLELEFNGYDTVNNLTMRLTHLWDMKIEPYVYRNQKNEAVPPIEPTEELEKINRSPYYIDSIKFRRVIDKEINTLLNYMPILSYDLDLKNLVNKEVELYSGSSISVPELISYTSSLSIQVLDDENKRWRRWFQNYMENLYDEELGVVKPYKNNCLKITIYDYKSDRKALSKKILLCTLKNYRLISNGTGAANMDIIDVQLGVVGMLTLPIEQSYLNVI